MDWLQYIYIYDRPDRCFCKVFTGSNIIMDGCQRVEGVGSRWRL